jgi:hypothetical protein
MGARSVGVKIPIGSSENTLRAERKQPIEQNGYFTMCEFSGQKVSDRAEWTFTLDEKARFVWSKTHKSAAQLLGVVTMTRT